MEVCCDEDGEYSVRPILAPARCSPPPAECYVCLPSCGKTAYCCEKPKPRESRQRQCCQVVERRPCPPPNNHQDCYYVHNSSPPRPSCCEVPVKTKYIVPCYRYEDGRIDNQPTALMRLACEVAVGQRPRKAPYLESCFVQEGNHQESRYIKEDEQIEQGNCCFHYEKQKAHQHQHQHQYQPQRQHQPRTWGPYYRYCMEVPPYITACAPQYTNEDACYYSSCPCMLPC